MVRAIWNDTVIAESDNCEIVEENYYFPPEDVNKGYFQESDTQSTCPWKGQAHYYNIVVNEEINEDAAWYYPDPNPAAKKIKGYIAFWKGISIEE